MCVARTEQKKDVHFIYPETPPGVAYTDGKAKRVHRSCPFCGLDPCFIDRDENYERLVVLGTAMEAEGRKDNHIRAAIKWEMTYHYNSNRKSWCEVPYCVDREIKDAYPPSRSIGDKKSERILIE
jgi:hypothetical protein